MFVLAYASPLTLRAPRKSCSRKPKSMYAAHEMPIVLMGVFARSIVGCCLPLRKTTSNAGTSRGSAKRYHALALLPE